MKRLGAVFAVLILLTLLITQVVYAQEETPPVEEIMETPSTFLNWIIENGGAAYLAGALVSILCWMSKPFNALPSDKKRLIANVLGMVFGVLAQVVIMLFIQKPEWFISVENIWKYVVWIVTALIGLNKTYLKDVRQQPAVIYTTEPVQ